MTYSELLFRRNDDQLIYPDDARRMVASACDGVEIDPAIFTRDETGKTLSGVYGSLSDGDGYGVPPRIVFDGGPGYVRMYGIGTAGSSLLRAQAPKLFAAMYSKGFRSIEDKSGEMSLKWLDDGSPTLYAMRYLIVAKKPNQCQRYIKAPLTGDVRERVGQVILRGLCGVARMLDEERMEKGLAPVYLSAVPSSLMLLEGTPCPIQIQPGIKAAAYKNVLLTLPCKLNGPWVTGLLRARGFGLIRLVNPTRKN